MEWENEKRGIQYLYFVFPDLWLTAATIIKPSDDFSETENRSLAQMPKLTGKNILDGTFESGL